MSEQSLHSAMTRMTVKAFTDANDVEGWTAVTELADKLDRAQAAQDHGPDTVLPYWMAQDAQVQHSLGLPGVPAADSIKAIATYIARELDAARQAHGTEAEYQHLGNALHALQDSYSQAHLFRDQTGDRADPRNGIQAVNVYTPVPALLNAVGPAVGEPLAELRQLGATGLSLQAAAERDVHRQYETGTHDVRFDRWATDTEGNPVLRPEEHAAIRAGAELLTGYRAGFEHPETFDARVLVAPFFRTAPDARVNEIPDPRFRDDVDQRLHRDDPQEPLHRPHQRVNAAVGDRVLEKPPEHRTEADRADTVDTVDKDPTVRLSVPDRPAELARTESPPEARAELRPDTAAERPPGTRVEPGGLGSV